MSAADGQSTPTDPQGEAADDQGAAAHAPARPRGITWSLRVAAPLLGGVGAVALGWAALGPLSGAPPLPLPELGAAVGLWLLAAVLGGPRLRLLLPPADAARAPGAARLGLATIGVHALNLALPGPAGDLALLAALRARGVPTLTAGAALLAGRALGLGAIGALALLALPATQSGAVDPALWVGLLPAAGGAALLGAAALRPSLLTLTLLRPLRALNPARPWGALVHRRLLPPLTRIAEGLAAASAPSLGRPLGALGLSLAMQALLLGALGVLLRGLGHRPPLAELAVAHSVGELVTVALAIAPAGLGALEAGLGGALHLLCALSPPEAAAAVLLLRGVQLLSLAVGAPLAGLALPGLLARPT